MDSILKALVEIPTVAGNPEAIRPAIEWIDQYVSERGMYVKRFNYNGVESLVATTQQTKKPALLLAAHVDVVPGPEESFLFREENGRYYGRGVADMKFAIAAYLQLVDELRGSLRDYDFGIMITSDEEVGGFNGTKRLVEEGYTADVVILPDSGDTPDAWKLERSAKGRIALEIKSLGKSAHGSRPWKGENAIDKLIATLDDIRSLFPDQGHNTNTLAITTINGGEALNQIPANASAELDVRTLSDDESDTIRRQISDICHRHQTQMIEDTEYCNACRLDRTNPYVQQFIACAQQVLPEGKLVESDSTGGSDARFFAAAGIPCIVAGPPCDGYHSTNEWISREGVAQLLEILRLYAERVAKTAKPVDASAVPM